MVGHQAIREYSHLIFFSVFLQPVQVGLPIFVREKDVLAAIPPLGDVMGHLGANGSGKTRHEQNLS